MLANPRALIRGSSSPRTRSGPTMRSSTSAVRSHVIRRMHAAVPGRPGCRGTSVTTSQGSGFNLNLVVHSGAGAYICGEETALLDSLEGRRGQPAPKPPFPAVATGLYACPPWSTTSRRSPTSRTSSTTASDWFRPFGTESHRVSKSSRCPATCSARGSTRLRWGSRWRTPRVRRRRAGAMLKFWLPGGSSVPMLTPSTSTCR